MPLFPPFPNLADMKEVRYRWVRVLLPLILLCVGVAESQPSRVSSALAIARVKYSGGGDWYNDPSAEVNLLKFFAQETGTEVDARYQFVEVGDDRLYSYPFLFLTGHGNIVFSDEEARRLLAAWRIE